MGFGGTARGINDTMADTMRMRSDRNLAMSDRLENGLAGRTELSRHSTKTSSSKDDGSENG